MTRLEIKIQNPLTSLFVLVVSAIVASVIHESLKDHPDTMSNLTFGWGIFTGVILRSVTK